MKNISSNYKENIKLFGRQIDSKITYELDGEEIELGAEELNSVTPHYESSILKSVMKQLDVDSNVEIPIGSVINYQFGVKTGNAYEYIDYGNYVVYKSEKQEDTKSWKLTCYDKMLYSMVPYESLDVTYPITVKNLLVAICEYMGVEFANENDNFVNSDKQITSELYLDSDGNSLDYTYRDVLDELAQVTASVICINDEDKLEIRYVNNTGEYETVEGTELSLENVDDKKDIEYILKGNTYQETTPTPTSPQEVQTVTGRQDISVVGKNLFTPNLLTSATFYGLTIKANEDGSITINGTSTNTSAVWYNLANIDYGVTGLGVYSVSTTRKSTTVNGYTISAVLTNGTLNAISYNNNNKFTAIQINPSSTFDDAVVYIQIQEGTLTEWEEYKGHNYELNLGKNLLKNNSATQTLNGITYTVNPDKSITLNGTSTQNFIVPIDTTMTLETGTYTLSLKGKIQGCGIYAYDNNWALKTYVNSNNTPDNWKTNFTLSSTTFFAQVRIDIQANKTFDNITIYPMIEKGTQATSYSPYKTPIELCKIGNYQDKIYKNNGKWYLEKQIGKVVLDGTQNIPLASGTPRRFNATYTAIGIDNVKSGTTVVDTQSNYRMCDHFTYTNGQATWGNYYLHNNWIVMLDSNSVIASASDLSTWLSNNNTTIYYVLATPTTTEITDIDLLNQLNSVELLEGLNNISVISSNLSSPLNLTYVSELDTIDEEYLKDVNVNFGEKFGPVNAVVLSRSAESDSIYQRDESSVETNGICEVKIKDNQILNGNNRDEFLPEIFNKLNGLEYYLTDFTSTGITFYDLLDRYKVKVEDNYYKTIMFNDEVDITQGLEEQVYANELEETETDYTKSDKTDRRINQAYIIVDKQNQQINSVVQSINTLQNTVNEQGEQVEAIGTRVTQTIDNITASVSNIQETLDNGVNLVKTTSVTINDEGLSVSTDTSKIKTTMTNNEFKIVDSSNTTLAKFGYDEEEQISVAVMDNLTVENYFVAGYHRTEKMEVDGEHRTGVFYIGG